MTELENISSLLISCLKNEKKSKTQQPKPYSKKNIWKKKIKPWHRNTCIVSFKAKRKPPHTQPRKRTSAVLEHPVLFMFLFFSQWQYGPSLSLTHHSVFNLFRRNFCLQILCYCSLHLTLYFCLSLSIPFVCQIWVA